MRLLLSLILVFFTSNVFAQSFDNLTSDDFEGIIEDMSALLTHTSVSGADGLGDIFGFEVGIIAGVSETPEIDRISKDVSGGTDSVDQLPHGGIFAAVTFPFSITGELNILPEIEAEDGDLSNTSIAVKWTFSDFLDWPLDVAVKVSNTDSEFNFTQDDPAPNTTVSYESTIQTVSLIASKNFVLFEPYGGFGFVSADGEMSASQNIFTVSGSTDDEKLSGTMFFAGANLNLLFFKLGVEVGKVFDSTKASIKTSFYF